MSFRVISKKRKEKQVCNTLLAKHLTLLSYMSPYLHIWNVK